MPRLRIGEIRRWTNRNTHPRWRQINVCNKLLSLVRKETMKRRDFLKIACAAPLLPTLAKLDQPYYRNLRFKDGPYYQKVLDLTKEDIFLYRCLAKAYGSKLTHDFEKSFDTIMEKYESLYVAMVQVSCGIHHARNNCGPCNQKCYSCPKIGPVNYNDYKKWGANFIITTPMISEIFQTATCGWTGRVSYQEQPRHKEPIDYLGCINSRWKVYVSSILKPWDIILGCTDEKGFILSHKENWGYVQLINFII